MFRRRRSSPAEEGRGAIVADGVVLSGTYAGPLHIGDDGESYTLRGTVLGDVELFPGGSLILEGVIDGTLFVHRGSDVYIRGHVVELAQLGKATIELHEMGPYHSRMGEHGLPFTGPVGWRALETAWASSVVATDNAIRLGGLDGHGEDKLGNATEEAFRAVVAAIGLAQGTDDARLWGLLGAAVFNANPALVATPADAQSVWSPQDCREKISWDNDGRYFGTPPPLFSALLPKVNRAGISLAFGYFDALLSLIHDALAAGDEPPAAAMTTVEAWDSMLVEELVAAQTGDATAADQELEAMRARRARAGQTDVGGSENQPGTSS
jgi:hypothetical protein